MTVQYIVYIHYISKGEKIIFLTFNLSTNKSTKFFTRQGGKNELKFFVSKLDDRVEALYIDLLSKFQL